MELAEEWSTPAYQIEQDCSEYWFNWWLLKRKAKGTAMKALQSNR